MIRSARLAFALLMTLLLASCDDGAGARQALAQCKLAPEATRSSRYYEDFPYLRQCMQSKGFVEDSNLFKVGGESCGPDMYSYQVAACYRRDTALAGWLAENLAKAPN